MEDQIRQQADAVLAIENEIRQAALLPEQKPFFTDRLRRNWDRWVFQSTTGSWAVRLLLTLSVFLSLFVCVRYGLSDTGSLVNDGVKWIARYTEDTDAALLAAEILLSLIWLWTPMLGTLLIAPVLYFCFAGMAILPLLLAFTLLVLFLFEDRAVLAFLIGMPPLLLLTPCHVGIFLVVMAVFISLRGNSGLVKGAGFLYLALLELSGGFFGTVADANGKQCIPSIPLKVSAAKRIKAAFNLLQSGDTADDLFVKILLFLGFFLFIGLVFSKLTGLRYASGAKKWFKKIPIDLKDGFIFILLAVLFCALPYVWGRITVIKTSGYSMLSVMLQLIAAYLLTRPIAGKTQKRGEAVMHGDKDYIFISYSHADLERVMPYLKLLDKNGYEYWYDDSIKTGTEWQGVIASNLKNCSCFLAFISANSVDSEYCLKEINYATSKNKPMAVIMLDDVMLPPVLEMHLASLQAVKREKFDSDTDCMQKVFEMEQFKMCKYD